MTALFRTTMNGTLLLKCFSFALFFCGLMAERAALQQRLQEATETPTAPPTDSPIVSPSFLPSRLPTPLPSLRPSLKPTKPPIGPPTFLPTFLVTKQVEDVLEFTADVTLHGVFWDTLDEPSLAALNAAAAKMMGISSLAVKATQTFGVFESNNDAVDDGQSAPAAFTAAYAKETLARAKVGEQFTSYAVGVQHSVYLNMVDFPSAESTDALYRELKGKLLNATYIYDADPDAYNLYSTTVREEGAAQSSTLLSIAKLVGTEVGAAQITLGSATKTPSYKPTVAPGNTTLSTKKNNKDLSGTGELGVLGVLGLVAAAVYMCMCCGCVIMYRREKQRQKAEQAELNQLAAAHAAAQEPSQRGGSVAGDMEEVASQRHSIPEDRYRPMPAGEGYPEEFYANNYNAPPQSNNNMYAPTNGAHYPLEMRGNNSVVDGFNPNDMNSNNNGNYNGGFNQNNGNNGYGNYNDNTNNSLYGNGGNSIYYGGNGYNDTQPMYGAPPPMDPLPPNVEMTPLFSVQTDQHTTYPLPPQHGAGFNSFYGQP